MSSSVNSTNQAKNATQQNNMVVDTGNGLDGSNNQSFFDESNVELNGDEMVVDHDGSYPSRPTDAVASSATMAIIDPVAVERRAYRPSYKLSVKLIDTYKNINKLYYEGKAKKLKEKQAAEALAAGTSSSTNPKAGVNNDGYDDNNFNYILTDGELFGNRYVYKHKIGSGSFGQVICAEDKIRNEDVAIKIIKSKKPFLIQAQTEIDLLKLIKNKQVDFEGHEADFCCITLEDTFMHHNHQCLVFEMLSHNLYDLLRNSRFKGVSFGLVRKFGRQILSALDFLSRPDVDIVHCDLKPENILLRNPKRSAIKLIDFGSSCLRTHRPYTYIQSRFYRSPEVLLCIGYDQKIDIWSLGCVLVEMHTGEPLFGGKDQLDQLFRIAATMGMPPISMIEASPQATRSIFFERVAVTKPGVVPDIPSDINVDPRKYIFSSDRTACYFMKKPKSFSSLPASRTLEEVLGVYTGGPGGRRLNEENHTVEAYQCFLDLIRKFLQYNPKERISAADSIHHQFFSL